MGKFFSLIKLILNKLKDEKCYYTHNFLENSMVPLGFQNPRWVNNIQTIDSSINSQNYFFIQGLKYVNWIINGQDGANSSWVLESQAHHSKPLIFLCFLKLYK